jgi:hypothetical protein
MSGRILFKAENIVGDRGHAHKDEGNGGRQGDDGEGEHGRRAAERRQPERGSIGPLGRCASTGSGQRPSGSASAQRRIELCRMSAYLKA